MRLRVSEGIGSEDYGVDPGSYTLQQRMVMPTDLRIPS
jgi:hypothetical protein